MGVCLHLTRSGKDGKAKKHQGIKAKKSQLLF